MRHRDLCTTEEENNNKTKSQESSHGSEDPDGGCEVPPALSSWDQGVLAQHHASCRRAQSHLCLLPSHSPPAPPALAEPAGPTRSGAPAPKTKAALFSRQISEDRRRPCPSRTGRGHTGAQHGPPQPCRAAPTASAFTESFKGCGAGGRGTRPALAPAGAGRDPTI